MARTATQAGRTPTTSVRLERGLIEQMDSVRDVDRFPTQSDFIREAVRRMVREERRNRTRERMKVLVQDPEAMELGRRMANAGWGDAAERWEKADRGEL
ncbi:MAG: ribbon-helix-helix domain-containing protein [Chloroflexota bacterium]